MAGTIYVHHITCYSGESVYEERAEKLTEAGFVRLRSEKGDDDKYWEVWYLPYLSHAKGPCKDMKEQEIVRWLMHNVGPGNIECEFRVEHSGTNWGAGVD